MLPPLQTLQSFMRIIALLLAASSLLVGQGFAQTRADTGLWYGGYELVGLGQGFELRADIIHLRNGDTGSATLTIFVDPQASCPDSLTAALCRDLKRAADERGFVDTQVTGARLVQQTSGVGFEDFWVAFRLPRDRADRLLVIEQQATERGAYLYHRKRGRDYQGYARRTPHMCETSPCSEDVFREVRNDPSAQYGALRDLRWAAALHNGSRQVEPRPLPADGWTIFEGASERSDAIRGTVVFASGASGLRATGALENWPGSNGRASGLHETRFSLVRRTDEAATFAVTTRAKRSGERLQGHLLVELPSFASGRPRGTLILNDEVMRITLAPGRGGSGTSNGGDGTRDDRPNADLVEDDDPQDDLPVIGIYRTDYRLRDIPPGKRLTLRRSPTRDSQSVGRLAANAGPLRMLDCKPYIDASRFNEASRAQRLRMLSAVWCEVSMQQARGWVPGRYLEPAE